MADHEALLRRHQPILSYDSLETYFADSAAEWTDLPRNELRTADGATLIASTATDPKLSLDFLGDLHERDGRLHYSSGRPVERGDYIGSPEAEYRTRYRQLRADCDRYANRVYARAVEENGRPQWLQYWFWYFYNDYNLAHRIGLHEGDWEMIELKLDDREAPVFAVYAQHTVAEARDWPDVESEDGHPLVYVARGSHASYFEPGEHETDVWYDLADGKRRPKELAAIEFLDDLSWARWFGVWGDTAKRPGRIEHMADQPSPTSPCRHQQWDHPDALVPDAKVHRRHRPRGAPPPPVNVRRRRGRLWFAYRKPRSGRPPYALQLNVNSSDDPYAPRTYTFEIKWAEEQSVSTTIELARKKSYEVYVAVADADGRATDSQLIEIDPFPPKLDLRGLARAIGWVTYVYRRLRYGPTGAPAPRDATWATDEP